MVSTEVGHDDQDQMGKKGQSPLLGESPCAGVDKSSPRGSDQCFSSGCRDQRGHASRSVGSCQERDFSVIEGNADIRTPPESL